MAKQEEPPGDDIPAWFMTYSDVITLLMTFFILLLTFATTEPEKYEKISYSAIGKDGATGIVGHPHDGLDRDAWVQRVRPPAARLAMYGSEMPPMMDEPSKVSVGNGLKAPSEDASKRDVMTTNSFQIPLIQLVNVNGTMTPRGVKIAGTVANQLRKLPVHCYVEVSDTKLSKRATRLLEHFYRAENVRPGQVGLAINAGVDSDSVRFVIERHNTNGS